MRIRKGSGPKKCIRCLRSKEEAIREHVRSLRPCDNPECPFQAIIEEAIEAEKNKPKFSFGTPQKPKLKFGEKIKSSLHFGEKKKS